MLLVMNDGNFQLFPNPQSQSTGEAAVQRDAWLFVNHVLDTH